MLSQIVISEVRELLVRKLEPYEIAKRLMVNVATVQDAIFYLTHRTKG